MYICTDHTTIKEIEMDVSHDSVFVNYSLKFSVLFFQIFQLLTQQLENKLLLPLITGLGPTFCLESLERGVRNKTQDQGLINGVWEEERTPVIFASLHSSSFFHEL